MLSPFLQSNEYEIHIRVDSLGSGMASTITISYSNTEKKKPIYATHFACHF
jgi:hypothetical protein